MKPIEYYATRGINLDYTFPEIMILHQRVNQVFLKTGFDFYSFTRHSENKAVMKANGYNLFDNKQECPDEEGKEDIFPFCIREGKKLWCKIDDYGNKFVITLLFPDEY